MKRKILLLPLLFVFGILFINPWVSSTFILIDGLPGFDSPSMSENPPTPQGPQAWQDIILEAEYAYDDIVTVSWSGKPSSAAVSPFNTLYNWTKSGSIDGGVYEGNPGNVTIVADAWDNTTVASDVMDFLNYTMENYVRFVSYPSLSIFNFTEYENQTRWEFNDAIAEPVEFLNTTFFLVNNKTHYLMDGFNASGIITSLTEYRIHLEWYEDTPVADVSFMYTIANIVKDVSGTFEFRLADAMGLQFPLKLTGEGSLILNGPYNRVILEGAPSNIFENKTFPYYPVGIETHYIDESEHEFDYTIRYTEGSSALILTREFSTNIPSRGSVVEVKVTVINTGNTPFTQLILRDLHAIETGMFQLVRGVASRTIINLLPGENATLEYTVLALVTGIYEYPVAQVVGIDIFEAQYTVTTLTESMTIGNGLVPSEILLIEIGAVVAIILIVVLIIYRYRRRIF